MLGEYKRLRACEPQLRSLPLVEAHPDVGDRWRVREGLAVF
jgi:hypothetical protein